mgnify:FL=1
MFTALAILLALIAVAEVISHHHSDDWYPTPR